MWSLHEALMLGGEAAVKAGFSKARTLHTPIHTLPSHPHTG